MNRVLPFVALSGFILVGAHAFADEPMNQMTTAQKHKIMKHCMSKQMAANSGMSKADMRQACKDEMMKAQTSDPTATVGSGGPADPAKQ
jgi:hypothetical protein